MHGHGKRGKLHGKHCYVIFCSAVAKIVFYARLITKNNLLEKLNRTASHIHDSDNSRLTPHNQFLFFPFLHLRHRQNRHRVLHERHLPICGSILKIIFKYIQAESGSLVSEWAFTPSIQNLKNNFFGSM